MKADEVIRPDAADYFSPLNFTAWQRTFFLLFFAL